MLKNSRKADKKGSNYRCLKDFYPDMYIDSAYDIDYKGLYDKGLQGNYI